MMTTASIKRDLSRKPAKMPIIAENIPAKMREARRWLGWRWEADCDADRWTKPPIDIRRNRYGSSTDPETWCDFATALAAAESSFVDGIGFALGDGYGGVDFDNCRDRETGIIAPDVLAYIRRLNTYGEVSPSGEGVKLILRGALPKGRRANGNVEVYDHGRYFTVTGHRLDGCPSELATNDAELIALHRELIEAPQTVSQHRRESRMDDRQLAVAALGGLSASRADDYYDWLRVGMALKAADPELLDAWDSWSQQSTKYVAGCCAAKWESFKGSAVGLGSLIYWAQQDTGWKPPRHFKRRAVAAHAPAEPFAPFPVDALPEPVRGFVVAGAKAIGCCMSYIALPLLITLAAAIGNSRRLQLKRGWTAPAIVWGAVVGESGTAKTPAFKLAMRAIRERQRKALERHAEAMRSHEVEVLRYEKQLNEWKRNKNAVDDPPTKPEPPQAERCVVSDTTIEALAPLLLANPRGLLLARDELAGWMGSFDRYAGGKGGADAAHWLSMHNGESIIVDRKTGIPRTIYVPRASVSVCGGIQPVILHRALGVEHRESGLAARLLLTCPPRVAKRWTEADIDPKVEAEIAQLVDRLYELQPTIGDEGELRPVVVGLTPDAKAAWKSYYNDHAQEQADLTGELSAAWSKLEEYAARLALVIHFARWAANDSTLASDDAVDGVSMAAGIRLATWFKGEARRVYAMLGESDEDRDQRRLVEWIGRKGGPVTPRDVQQGCRWLKEPGAAEAALEDLAKAGWGDWQDSPTTAKGGRPARVFALSTPSTVYETPANSEENVGFVDVDIVDAPETGLLDAPNSELLSDANDDEWGEV